jgi:hypothetical protein
MYALPVEKTSVLVKRAALHTISGTHHKCPYQQCDKGFTSRRAPCGSCQFPDRTSVGIVNDPMRLATVTAIMRSVV